MNYKPTRLYTLGPEGTFSDQATRLLLSKLENPETPIVYTRSIPEVLGRTESDQGSMGIFPIENSVSGTIGQAQDGIAHHRLTVLWEINIRVRFSLIANAPLEAVEVFYSHPQAFDQCSEYLAANLPHAEVIFTNSNSLSGKKFLELGADSSAGAIVPTDFGAAHPDLVAAEDIQDFSNNTTRFLVAHHADPEDIFDFSKQKTSLLIEPEEDHPGLLHQLLTLFHRFEVNLCRLESRPAKTTPWAYVFYIDFNNNPDILACLSHLEATRNRITILGSYDLLE